MAKNKIQRASRIYINHINAGKRLKCFEFLELCRNLQQYFVDLFWQRGGCDVKFADLETVHLGRSRFKTTTRLAQAMAKQAIECLGRKNRRAKNRKPRLHQQTTTLYYHFGCIEKCNGSFNYVLRLTGSGAPKITIPFNSTKHLNRLLDRGFNICRTIRIGRDKEMFWIDVIVEKEIPEKREVGHIIGMDSGMKNGFHFSDGQIVGDHIYNLICGFAKREKHTHEQVEQEINRAIKRIDWKNINRLAIEDLKYVKHYKRGTFPRSFNRRLSHWLYRHFATRLGQECEEIGVIIDRKNPAYTSQFCRTCFKWDRRNRKGDKFLCIECGEHGHADTHASENLELLGLAESYSIRSLASSIWML